MTGQMDPRPDHKPTAVRLSLPGLRVDVIADDRRVAARLDRMSSLPAATGRAHVEGSVSAYDERAVMRRVSARAVRVDSADPLMELYRDPDDGGRYWRVDERFGLCEIDLAKRCWRTWLLATSPLDEEELFEACVLWPLSHLARGSGLHLIPAAAASQGGRGVLMLSPVDLRGELDALSSAGVSVVGRRWVVMGEGEDGGVSVSALPGEGASAGGGRCALVLLIEPPRRSSASAMPVAAAAAREQIKASWPAPPLPGTSTSAVSAVAARLSRTAAVHRVRLGQNGADLARLLVRPAADARLRTAA